MNGNKKEKRFIIKESARKLKKPTRFTAFFMILLAVKYFFATMFQILTLDFLKKTHLKYLWKQTL